MVRGFEWPYGPSGLGEFATGVEWRTDGHELQADRRGLVLALFTALHKIYRNFQKAGGLLWLDGAPPEKDSA